MIVSCKAASLRCMSATLTAKSLRVMSPTVVVLLLALLLGIHPVATNLYLPVLPQLKSELGASMLDTQLTLSGLVLSFGIGQLFWGPLADRIGRRPVLLAGLSIYTLAGALSVLGNDVHALIVWRSLQGLGMAASVVCARAVVRDLYTPQQGVVVLSQGLSWMAVIALLCPMVGALLGGLGGFRMALVLLTLFGVLTLLLVMALLDETLPKRNLVLVKSSSLLLTWRKVMLHPTFITYICLTGSTYAGLFTFLSSSSFILIETLHLSPFNSSLMLSASAFCYLLGTMACRYCLPRHGIIGTVKRAGLISLLGGVSMAALSLLGMHYWWAILLPQCVYVFAHGMHQSCGQAAAIAPFPQYAGTAAALSGFIMALLSFAVGAGLGMLMDGSVYPLTLSVGLWSVLTAICAWTLVPRYGALMAKD